MVARHGLIQRCRRKSNKEEALIMVTHGVPHQAVSETYAFDGRYQWHGATRSALALRKGPRHIEYGFFFLKKKISCI